MHVMRHLPISSLSLPFAEPPKIHRRKIIIIKRPINYLNIERPQGSQYCPPKTDSEVPKHDTAPTVSRPVNSVKLHCCSICMRGFCEEVELKAHVENHSKARHLICKICGIGFVKESAFEIHIKRHSPKKPFACNMCKKSYSQSKLLSKHLLRHPKAKPFRCNKCTKGFLIEELLESHLQSHLSRGILCNICERRFLHEDHISSHFCVYSGKKPRICGICDRIYFCLTCYNSHFRSHTKEDLPLVRS